MIAFIKAALPWILCGLPIAIICSRDFKVRQSGGKVDPAILAGLGLGLVGGVALNRVGLWDNHIFGIAIGVLWGLAIVISRKPKETEE
ncbi:MAG: hypothetical protein Q4C54_04355 [Clostridia bacterium]|nr:hypothetical protein [Clostridia bacterium]